MECPSEEKGKIKNFDIALPTVLVRIYFASCVGLAFVDINVLLVSSLTTCYKSLFVPYVFV